MSTLKTRGARNRPERRSNEKETRPENFIKNSILYPEIQCGIAAAKARNRLARKYDRQLQFIKQTLISSALAGTISSTVIGYIFKRTHLGDA